MKVTNKLLYIVTKLKRHISKLIIIDGVDGSGKSALAKEIALELGCAHINLDDYLEKNRGSFVKHIKYKPLKSEMDKAESPFIIEGVWYLTGGLD